MKRICLLLAFLLFSLGCSAAGGGYSETEGLRINEFSFESSETTDYYIDEYDYDTVRLFLEVENVGAKTMGGDANVFVFGPALQAFDNERMSRWQIEMDGESPFDSGRGIITKVLDSDSFYPPDPENNLPGAVDSIHVDLIPPNLDESISTQYTFYARVCYPYTTSSIATLTKLNEGNMRAKVSADEESSRSSAGPISIRLESTDLVVRGSVLPINFVVKNVGGGFSTIDGCAMNPKVQIRNRMRFEAAVDGEQIDCDEDEIRLSDGEAVVRCSYVLSSEMPVSELHVTARSDYRYYIDKETSIRVSDSVNDKD